MIKVELLNKKLGERYSIDLETYEFYLKINENNKEYYIKYTFREKDKYFCNSSYLETTQFFTDESFNETESPKFNTLENKLMFLAKLKLIVIKIIRYYKNN